MWRAHGVQLHLDARITLESRSLSAVIWAIINNSESKWCLRVPFSDSLFYVFVRGFPLRILGLVISSSEYNTVWCRNSSDLYTYTLFEYHVCIQRRLNQGWVDGILTWTRRVEQFLDAGTPFKLRFENVTGKLRADLGPTARIFQFFLSSRLEGSDLETRLHL